MEIKNIKIKKPLMGRAAGPRACAVPPAGPCAWPLAGPGRAPGYCPRLPIVYFFIFFFISSIRTLTSI